MQVLPDTSEETELALAPETAATVTQATPAFSPLYQQIKALILNSLRSGEWKPGEAIPSEVELAARFRVSQGKGTFVATHAEQQVQFRFLKLVPDSGSRGSEGPAQRDIIECRRARASTDVAKALALRCGDAVLQVRRVLSFGGAPVILEDIWLPAVPFKGLTAERLATYKGPMYALFETEFNVRMVRAGEKIRAIAATQTHADLLRVPLGSPLLSVERIAFTYQSEPMELRKGYYRTDTHHYQNDMN